MWFQRYSNTLENAFLIVREFGENMILAPGFVHLERPKAISESKYDADISRAFEYGWTPKQGQKKFLRSKELASQCVIQFLDLINRDRDGKVRRESRY